MLSEIRQTYRDSVKPNDIVWNTYVARPVAALFVLVFKRIPITPNQVTFLGAFVFLWTIVPLVLWPDDFGFLIAALVIQLAYVFDCVDGQLARIKKMTSDVGSYLDFFIDEVKATIMVGALGVHHYLRYDDVRFLYAGTAAVALVSLATSLTTFVRRPEYCGREIKPGESARRSADRPTSGIGLLVWYVGRFLAFFVHYPSWILFPAIAGLFLPIDGGLIFSAVFMGVYCIYIAKTGAGVVFKLGRPGFYK